MTDLTRKALGAAVCYGCMTFMWWLASRYLVPLWVHDPVWLGYYDGEFWRDVETQRIKVSHWSDMPEPAR